MILVYCGANTLELGFIKEYPSIRGVVWCQGLGQEGMTALGEILTGAVNPSGRTSDTFIYDMTQTPWYNNFGDFAFDNAEEGIPIELSPVKLLVMEAGPSQSVVDSLPMELTAMV